MKTIGKVLLILIIAVLVSINLPQNSVFAADGGPSSSVIGEINKIQPSGGGGAAAEGLQNVIGKILGFLQVASGLVAVLMIAFNGFRYITSTPDIKSEIIKNVAPILAGLVLVFGATSFAKFMISIAGN